MVVLKQYMRKKTLQTEGYFQILFLSSPPNRTPSGEEAAAAGTAPTGRRHATLAEDNARRGLGSPNPP